MTSRRTKISPKSGRGLGHVTSTIFGSTVGYPSDSLASCLNSINNATLKSRSEVTQSHRNWYHPIACLWFPISVL